MNKIEKLFLYITSTLFFLSMFLMGFSSVCHANTVSSMSAPYVVPNNTGLNSGIDINAVLSLFENSFKPNMAQFYPNVDFDHCLMYIIDPPNSNNGNISIYLISEPQVEYAISSDTLYNQFDFMNQTITFSHTSRIFTINTNINTYNYLGSNQYDGRPNLFGAQTTVVRDSGNYTILYPFLLIGYDDLMDSTGNYVMLTNNIPYQPSIPTQGHATQPTNDPNNFINGSNGSPLTKPTFPTINNYNWTVYQNPPIDNTNLESLVESLIDNVIYGFDYLASNLQGEFSNLINNLSNLFDYLVGSIESAINKIIKSIQDIMTDLYNNFVSLFEPITEQLFYITQELDTNVIQSEVENTSLIADYSEVVTLKDSFISVFTDTSEPSTFTIPIHLENLSILNVGTQYIDLSVINPVKSALRTFIWVLVSFGLVVTILDAIPNYINGGGDE